MHKDVATRILRKNDIGYNLPADKESVKHFGSTAALSGTRSPLINQKD